MRQTSAISGVMLSRLLCLLGCTPSEVPSVAPLKHPVVRKPRPKEQAPVEDVTEQPLDLPAPTEVVTSQDFPVALAEFIQAYNVAPASADTFLAGGSVEYFSDWAGHYLIPLGRFKSLGDLTSESSFQYWKGSLSKEVADGEFGECAVVAGEGEPTLEFRLEEPSRAALADSDGFYWSGPQCVGVLWKKKGSGWKVTKIVTASCCEEAT